MLGKVVYILQWIAIVATPIWWVSGSTITGGGWGTVFAELLAIPAVLFALVGPIVGLASRRLRAAQAMPPFYSVLIAVQWVLGFLWPLTIAEADDTYSTNVSVFSSWGIPTSVAAGLGVVFLIGYGILGIAALVVLSDGAKPLPVKEI